MSQLALESMLCLRVKCRSSLDLDLSTDGDMEPETGDRMDETACTGVADFLVRFIDVPTFQPIRNADMPTCRRDVDASMP